MGVRLVFACALTAAVAAWMVFAPVRAVAVTPGPSCGAQLVKDDSGVAIRVLFAKNGAVQRYDVVNSKANPESVNDLRLRLEQLYGPAGVNAPPVSIVSFKKGAAGGMMVPDKAVDSCGRTSSFL